MVDKDQWIFMREGCQYIGDQKVTPNKETEKCGHKVLPGKSYCQHHYNVVHETSET